MAEHSVLLARAVAPENQLWALLHDATEAYLVDVPRPLKPFLVGYREAEDKIARAVCERFGLQMPPEVKAFDTRISQTSASRWLPPPKPWSTDAEPVGVTLQYWTPEQAKREF